MEAPGRPRDDDPDSRWPANRPSANWGSKRRNLIDSGRWVPPACPNFFLKLTHPCVLPAARRFCMKIRSLPPR